MTIQFVIKACTIHASYMDGCYWQSHVLVRARDTRSNMHAAKMVPYMRSFRRKKKCLRINLGSHALQGSAESRHDIGNNSHSAQCRLFVRKAHQGRNRG